MIGRDVTWDDSLFPYNLWSGNRDKDLEINNDDNAAFCPLGAVVDSSFTWGNDTPPNIPWHKTVIYEAHIKSLSYLHPGVCVDGCNGPFAGTPRMAVTHRFWRIANRK